MLDEEGLFGVGLTEIGISSGMTTLEVCLLEVFACFDDVLTGFLFGVNAALEDDSNEEALSELGTDEVVTLLDSGLGKIEEFVSGELSLQDEMQKHISTTKHRDNNFFIFCPPF